MTEYKVITQRVTGVLWPDVRKAAKALSAEVNTAISSGWEPQGEIASIKAGSSQFLLQALTKRR